MGKLVADITMSLDGFITGPDDAPGRGLGEPAVSQLRSTLLQILDRPAYTRRGGSSGPPT